MMYEIDPLLDSRWKALVERHPRASVFHSTSWLRAIRDVYKYDPVVISGCPGEAPLSHGLLFCRVNSWLTGRRLVSLPFSDHCDPLVDNAEQLDLLLLHLKQGMKAERRKYIEIRPTTLAPGNQTGFQKSLTFYSHSIDLQKSTQQLFQSFHKDCVQRKIKRAERESLQYAEGVSESLLNDFYRLLVKTRRRQHLPPQPIAWFRGLIAAFGDRLKIRVASKDNVAVASILTIAHKKTMTYKYGCSDARFNKLGGTPLLFWKMIQEAKTNGFESVDLGRSDIDNEGLVAFKEHWGAPRVPLNYWRYPHKSHSQRVIWKSRVVEKVVSVAPESSLVAAGKFLYPHIG
jgi:CelD/BcsL family acetyltransferase involved in cellulose biosynthesis